MLAVVVFILLVYGYSLFPQRLPATSLAIQQSFTVVVNRLVLVAPGLALGSMRGSSLRRVTTPPSIGRRPRFQHPEQEREGLK
jgi:hypothetical protein